MPEEIKPAAVAAPETTPVVTPPSVVTTPTTPPPPAPTEEEIATEAAEFIASQFGGVHKKPEKPAPVDEPAAPPAEVKPAAETPAEVATPDKPIVVKKKGAKKDAPTVDEVEAIARRIAAEEREAEAPAATPSAPKPEPAPLVEDHLSEEDRDHLVVLGEMEQINPAAKGIVQKQRDFLKRASDYRSKWEAKNDGEVFDPNAPEHNDFYKRHEPHIPKNDFKAAERSLIARDASTRAREELRKEYEPRFREFDAEKLRREVAPKIQNSVNEAVVEVFASIPEFEKLLDDGQGNHALTREAVNQMSAINPAIHHAVSVEAEKVMGCITELEKLTLMPQHHEFNAGLEIALSDGEVIYPHAVINKAFHELEEKLKNAPKADRLDAGKDFITNAERAARIQSIRESAAPVEMKKRQVAALNAAYWSISPEHIKNRLLSQSKARLAAVSKKFASLTKNGGAPGSGKSGESAAGAPPAKAPAKAGLTTGTSTASVSDTTDNTARIGAGPTKEDEEFARQAFA